ncbi:MAG: spherulation-specific family 4 protein [Nitrososphaera sp.]|uniref:spherulation-specific family 4 protein n=1 Tax=Nitrososphaera sp. TaxID=1971748 RepID=UPI003D6E7C45
MLARGDTPLRVVAAQSLAVTDMAGNSLALIKPGSQFIMSVGVTNTGDALSEYVAVLEARDSGGITRWLVTGSGLLGPGQSTRVSTVLSLDDPGRYTFRAFVVGSFERPLSFSPVAFASASVIDYPGIYVPLYKYPDLWKPDGVWNTLFKAKQVHPSVLFVVTVNPSSGPGDRQNSAHAHAISELQKSGVEYILGYVPTNYAQQNPGRTLDDLKAMVNRYRSWYPQVNGIMLDQAGSGDGQLPFYRELADYSRSQGLEFVRANPGAKAAEAYVGVFDNLAIYEGDALSTALQLQENTYFPAHPTEGFSFISKNVASLDPAYVAEIKGYVGLFYITDDVEREGDRNPYNSLPGYFRDLVDLLDGQPVQHFQ